jgi:hypothetical protein
MKLKEPETKTPPTPGDLGYVFDPEATPVKDPSGRLSSDPKFQEWLADMGYTKPFNWEEYGHRVPMDLLERVFTFQEMVQLWCEQFISGDLDDFLHERHPFIAKVHNSEWRFGAGKDYEVLARHLQGLMALCTKEPGFEIRLTWTRGCNEQGWSVHLWDLYLDAPIGILLYHKGEHILTVGVAPSKHGVFVSQVQLRKAHKNRWLYHIRTPYLDWVLQRLAEAFTQDPLWLVTGETAVMAVRKAYGSAPCGMTSETEKRLVAFYNQSLGNFTRTLVEDMQYYYRKYSLLVPTTLATQAEAA